MKMEWCHSKWIKNIFNKSNCNNIKKKDTKIQRNKNYSEFIHFEFIKRS